MKIKVLASGSKGNTTYLNINNVEILIDLGISQTKLINKLINISVRPENIKYIFITHAHTDHTLGLKIFVKRYNPIIVTSEKILDELKKNIEIKEYLLIEDELTLNNIKIKTFKVSHDTNECLAYIFNYLEKNLVFITDTGYINNQYHKLLENKDIYIIESNYDEEMLIKGKYNYQTKKRIASDVGHLSNHDCSRYLNKVIGRKTKCIILTHLSEDNNDPILAYKQLNDSLIKNNNLVDNVIIANKEGIEEMVVI